LTTAASIAISPWIEGLSDSQIIVHSSKDSAYNAWAIPEYTLPYDYTIYTDGSKMVEKVGRAWVLFRKDDQVPCLKQTIRLSPDTSQYQLPYWKHPPWQQNFQVQQRFSQTANEIWKHCKMLP
jgi:hypothetical protein